MDAKLTHELALLAAHLHDISVSALAAAVVTLGVVILLELRSVMRLRHVVDNHLGRVFEQLDLLRFETQQLLEGQQAIEVGAPQGFAPTIPPARTPAAMAAAPSAPTPTPAPALRGATLVGTSAAPSLQQNVAALAASGSTSREIAERLGLATGEARLLSSLAQARARRLEAASA